MSYKIADADASKVSAVFTAIHLGGEMPERIKTYYDEIIQKYPQMKEVFEASRRTILSLQDVLGSKELDALSEIFGLQKIYDRRVQDPAIPRVAEILGVELEKRLFNKLTWLIHEAVELQRECNMKWWKQPKPFNKAHAKEELIDILHFWVSAALELDMTPQEVLEEYRKKNKVNHNRQDNNY